MGLCSLSKNEFKSPRIKQAQIGNSPPVSSIDPDLYYLYRVIPSVCIIQYFNVKGRGFLIKLKGNNHSFFCLMTNENVIKDDTVERKIEVLYDNQEKKIEIILDKSERFIKSFKYLNINCVVVEILLKDCVDEKYFLSPNENYVNSIKDLIKKEIYIPLLSGGKNLSYSKGLISNINKEKENEFTHTATTDYGSSGSPIFLIKTKEIIGMHMGTNNSKSSNFGNFLYPLINELKNLQNKNEIHSEDNQDLNYDFTNNKYSNYLLTDLYDINERIKRSVWKLYSRGGQYSTGFFCLIPSNQDNNLIPVFITCCFQIPKEKLKNGYKIEIYNNEKLREIEISPERKIYCGNEQDMDITIIEIKPKDKINVFLELDEPIISGNDIVNNYKNKSIYTCNYINGSNFQFSFGKITDVMSPTTKFDGKYILHTCKTFNGSGGAPILSSSSNKVIAVHKGIFSFKNEHKIREMGVISLKGINDFINSKNLYKI